MRIQKLYMATCTLVVPLLVSSLYSITKKYDNLRILIIGLSKLTVTRRVHVLLWAEIII